MDHTEGVFEGEGGQELYRQSWRPAGEARAALAIVHGLGEHSGRYMNVVHHLVPRGWAVHGFDHRGFGRSPGPRGHIDDWAQFRGDVRAFVRRLAGEGPLFLMGHSMGGLIALDYVLHHAEGLRGLVVSGAGLEASGVAKPHLVMLARLLSRIWPRFSLDVGLDASGISRDPEVVRAYGDDPLTHSRGSVRFGTETLDVIEWIKARPAEIALPLLMVHGGADRLVSPEGTRAFFERVTFADKELHVYEDVFHEPHNDFGREQMLADLESWLERHL